MIIPIAMSTAQKIRYKRFQGRLFTGEGLNQTSLPRIPETRATSIKLVRPSLTGLMIGKSMRSVAYLISALFKTGREEGAS